MATTEYTEWQWLLSITRVKSTQAGEGGGARPPPFTISTITHKVIVYAPAERAYTLYTPPTYTGFIRGGVRYAKSLRVLFLHRRSPSWTTLVLYSRAVFIFNDPPLFSATIMYSVTATFWSTFHHDGKIIPAWRGWGDARPSFFTISASCTKLWCTLQLRGQIHYPKKWEWEVRNYYPKWNL